MPVDGIAVTVVNEVAQFEGEIDMATAAALDAALEALPGTLRLDLSEVTFLDSSGVSSSSATINNVAKTAAASRSSPCPPSCDECWRSAACSSC